jgi:hypothetical protein
MVSAPRGWELAFGDLAEEIYVQQPVNFVAIEHKCKVLKLHKVL